VSQGIQDGIRLGKGALAAGAFGLVISGIVGALVLDHLFHEHSDEHAAHGEEAHADHDDGEEAHGHDEGKHEEGEHEDGEHEEGHVKLSPEALKNARLEVRKAGPAKIAVTLSLPGELTLNADAVAHVTPRVAGTVREVRTTLGDVVKKGDVLAILDSRDLAEMQREVSAARERLMLAENGLARQETLFKEKIGAEKDYIAAKQAVAEARIEWSGASQKLAASAGSGARGAAYALIAPLDGTVVEKHANVGEVMKEDTQAFTVADLTHVWVDVTVYAKDLPRVAAGQRARVRAEGIEAPVEGSISYLGAIVGEQTRSAHARIVLTNPGAAWRPGLFVTAEVAIDEADVPIAVEDGAIQSVEGKDVVFVQEGDAFEARPVTLGRSGVGRDGAPAMMEIIDGIAAGDLYVAQNSFLLKAELGKSEAGHEH
jgi:cobalt-zinc-cadmium efflux system membrane fusion protein